MFPPEMVQAKVKIEDFPEEIGEIMGVPSRFFRSEAEQADKQQEQQEQQEQLEAQALAQQGGK